MTQNTKRIVLIFLGIIAIWYFSGCGSSVTFKKSPLDDIIRDYTDVNNFSIILYDMDYSDTRNAYQHKYRILIPKEDTVEATLTDWYDVSDNEFKQYENNMGMVIASKINGEVKKTVAPPGYDNYVGNKKYGKWVERDGGSFWEFYGKYAFMSSMFNMAMYPIRYSYWNDYRTNYYGYNRPYYGPVTRNGNYMYGTRSNYTKNTYKKASWNNKPNSFKQKVRNKVQKSTTAKKTKSFSRYKSNSSSSFRSRSGGFGK